MKHSASALACGQSGVILLCSIPFSFMYSSISRLVNGGPLSLRIVLGIPCVAKIRSSLGIIAAADVDRTMSTSGNLE